MDARKVFESILTVPAVKRLWAVNYQNALPFTLSSFSIGAVMPAVLYLFRWGHRRGKGKFVQVYGNNGDNRTVATIESVTDVLISHSEWFEGFDSMASRAILGDMLLSACLENKKRQTGKTEQVQRAYPTHYLSSWIDLPTNAGSLRFIPELIVALLVQQDNGATVLRSTKRSHFSVGGGFEENILLSLFGNGMEASGKHLTSLTTSERFCEYEPLVGLDQLLTIRLAQGCGEAPVKAIRGESDQIPNQWPLATLVTEHFREDFSVFVRAYGTTIPRQTLLQMLESCIAMGLSTIFFSTITMLLTWEKCGTLPSLKEQRPWPLFVDCSNGNDGLLRRLAEESMADFTRRLERIPFILMCLRILEDKVRNTRTPLRDSLPSTAPNATEFINLLGEVFTETHNSANRILEKIDEDCLRIAEVLSEEEVTQSMEVEPTLRELLTGSGNPVARLAEALCSTMGDKNFAKNYKPFILALLMAGEPNGLALKRRAYARDRGGKMVSVDAHSLVLTNTMLDLLVHRHLRKAAKGNGAKSLTFIKLLQILKERYGLYVDEAPQGMSIPVEMLLRNKRILERRLRDLGVLVGVNDAESMKRLRQRFHAVGDE